MNASEPLAYLATKFQIDLAAHTPIEFKLSRHTGLVQLWAELGYTTGAEIGVEQGKFSEEICKANPGVRLTCVDPWRAYDRYKDHVSQGKLDQFYVEACARLAPYECTIIRESSMVAVSRFLPTSLDFVFIDGNHEYQHVVNDICEWARIVRPGGMVAGHDYRREHNDHPIPFHVIQAINSYTDAYDIKPWFVLRGDKAASWMFVKQ